MTAAVLLARRGQVGDPRRALLGRRELGDLTGPAALSRARQLRPSLADQPAGRQADRRDRGDRGGRGARGVRLLRVRRAGRVDVLGGRRPDHHGSAGEQDQRGRRADRAVRTRPGRRHLQQGRPVGAHRRAARPGRAGVDLRPAADRVRRADLVVGPAAGDPRRRPTGPGGRRRPAGRALPHHPVRGPQGPVLHRRRRTGPHRHPARRRRLRRHPPRRRRLAAGQPPARGHRAGHRRRARRGRRPRGHPRRRRGHHQRHLPDRPHRHQGPDLRADPALDHPTPHLAHPTPTRPAARRTRRLATPHPRPHPQPRRPPHGRHRSAGQGAGGGADGAPAVQGGRRHRRPGRRRPGRPDPRGRRTRRPGPRRPPRPTPGRRARRGREHLPHPGTAPALQPLRQPRHPGPDHAAELPAGRRGVGHPRHGRALVRGHRQAGRRRRRRPPVPAASSPG